MVTTEVHHMRDEIKDYKNMISVGSSKASWKLLEFRIAENKPPVQVIILLEGVLCYHLFSGFVTTYGDQQHIFFVGGEEANAIEQGRETELTSFFKLNAEEKEELGNNSLPRTYLSKQKGQEPTHSTTKDGKKESKDFPLGV